jgi:hypothetical protein
MVLLAGKCNVARIKTLYDRQATTSNVTQAIQEVGRQCAVGDFFIFFYAGHGCQMPDQDGDERDGKDDAYCLVDADGGLSAASFLRDDDFARIVTTNVARGVNILIISDCCHSGTVADFSKCEWKGHRAVSMSGCQDKETSGDTGRGGIFTHSLLIGVEKLNKYCGKSFVQQPTSDVQSRQPYSVGTLFRAALDSDDRMFKSPQHLSIQAVPGLGFDAMRWPLVPPKDYQAPWNQSHAAGVKQECATSMPQSASPPQQLLLPAAVAESGSAGKPPAEKPRTRGCLGCFRGGTPASE